MLPRNNLHTRDYLKLIGVSDLPPLTSPFDPGYDPVTLEGHLEQSPHLMAILKVSMACWMVANEDATRRKVASATKYHVPTVTGGGPFEIAVAQDCLEPYLDLCADIGFTRIECGEGFTDMPLGAREVVKLAGRRGLDVQFELGKKHTGAFNSDTVRQLISQGRRWLDAGARELVVEARESAKGVGLFDDDGNFNAGLGGPVRERIRPGYGNVRSPQQAQPVRAPRSLRATGAALQCPAGGAAAGGDLQAGLALGRVWQGESSSATSRNARHDALRERLIQTKPRRHPELKRQRGEL